MILRERSSSLESCPRPNNSCNKCACTKLPPRCTQLPPPVTVTHMRFAKAWCNSHSQSAQLRASVCTYGSTQPVRSSGWRHDEKALYIIFCRVTSERMTSWGTNQSLRYCICFVLSRQDDVMRNKAEFFPLFWGQGPRKLIPELQELALIRKDDIMRNKSKSKVLYLFCLVTSGWCHEEQSRVFSVILGAGSEEAHTRAPRARTNNNNNNNNNLKHMRVSDSRKRLCSLLHVLLVVF